MRIEQLYYTRMVPTAVVTRRGVDRIRLGHPWIYRSDVADVEAAPGDLVHVVTERGRPIGWAFWSDRSQISLRMVVVGHDRAIDEPALWRDRLRAALDYRAELGIAGTAGRLVHGESDRLPGLIVDRYGDYLVVQTLCQGTDRRLAELAGLLRELTSPRGVLARNDPKVRRLEGLEERVQIVAGEVPPTIEVEEAGVRLEVDLWAGQKTGLFLDQRENHTAAARYARGRVLDAFSYQGGFALPMARHAERVLALDASAAAVAAVQANARRNGLSNLDAREVNVFDALRELEVDGERFETIVLDPPAFAKNRAAVERALAGYKEINLRALKLLAPGGHLVTCSCSYNVDEPLFLAVVEEAASDAHATVALVEKRLQARDHPVLVGVPETYYLKCLILRKIA
jgi:23S rRNA (cytosine1962-C5)-methyltransferase